MPDPEIDRRCATCGASVRPRAMFCPQCGQGIEQVKESDRNSELHVEEKNPPDLSRTVEIHREALPDLSRTVEIHREALPDLSRTVEIHREALPDLSETQPLIAVRPPNPELAQTQALPALPTAPQPSRRLDGNVKGKVDKLRKASSVVIDQAAYDPSIRFLLVAAALLLVFLFLLLFSKILG